MWLRLLEVATARESSKGPAPSTLARFIPSLLGDPSIPLPTHLPACCSFGLCPNGMLSKRPSCLPLALGPLHSPCSLRDALRTHYVFSEHLLRSGSRCPIPTHMGT